MRFFLESPYDEYVLIEKEDDDDQIPESRWTSFDGQNQGLIIPANKFSGHFQTDFIIRMWMKHKKENSTDKEHIFCQTDEKCKTFQRIFFSQIFFLL